MIEQKDTLTKNGKKVGRPRIEELTEENVYKLACEGLTYRSIANILGCEKSILEKRFSATIKAGHAQLGQNLRQRLVERALGEDDKTCQIYLDKRFNRDEQDDSGSFQLVKKINLKKIDSD